MESCLRQGVITQSTATFDDTYRLREAPMTVSIRPYRRLLLTYVLGFGSLITFLILSSGSGYAEWVKGALLEARTRTFGPIDITPGQRNTPLSAQQALTAPQPTGADTAGSGLDGKGNPFGD